MTASQIRQLAQPGSDRYRFVWGASPALMPAWTSLPASIRPILSWYMPYSRDISPAECRLGSSGGGDCVKGRNISWYEAHQRDWVLYQCDQRTPAFQYGDLNVPLDFTNPSVIEYQASLAMSARDAGYTAIAADNLAFENFAAFNACGVWRDDGRWEQIFSGEVNDPRFAEATVAWAERFRQLLQKKMRLVINFSTHPPASGGSTALVLRLDNATDGILDEFGFVNIAAMLPGGVAGWLDKVRWMQRLQSGGVAYYSNN